MQPIEFTKWLSDLLEFNPDLKELNEIQTNLIKSRLMTVFHKITPNASNGFNYNFGDVMEGKSSNLKWSDEPSGKKPQWNFGHFQNITC